MTIFNESQHPRAKSGEFANKHRDEPEGDGLTVVAPTRLGRWKANREAKAAERVALEAEREKNRREAWAKNPNGA
jgi:hypothetical protein